MPLLIGRAHVPHQDTHAIKVETRHSRVPRMITCVFQRRHKRRSAPCGLHPHGMVTGTGTRLHGSAATGADVLPHLADGHESAWRSPKGGPARRRRGCLSLPPDHGLLVQWWGASSISRAAMNRTSPTSLPKPAFRKGNWGRAADRHEQDVPIGGRPTIPCAGSLGRARREARDDELRRSGSTLVACGEGALFLAGTAARTVPLRPNWTPVAAFARAAPTLQPTYNEEDLTCQVAAASRRLTAESPRYRL